MNGERTVRKQGGEVREKGEVPALSYTFVGRSEQAPHFEPPCQLRHPVPRTYDIEGIGKGKREREGGLCALCAWGASVCTRTVEVKDD